MTRSGPRHILHCQVQSQRSSSRAAERGAAGARFQDVTVCGGLKYRETLGGIQETNPYMEHIENRKYTRQSKVRLNENVKLFKTSCRSTFHGAVTPT